MAHLWFESAPGDWAVTPLSTHCVDLRGLQRRSVPVPADEPSRSAWLIQEGKPGQKHWHLIGNAQMSVNGVPLVGGLRVLSDRDEIRVAGVESWFFSTEELARVEPMPLPGKPIVCPRCRQHIDRDVLAVKCPACGLWHHQSDDLPCWTYAPTCALCPQPTPLDAGFQWTPVEL
jgi:hypothetical protein